MKGGFDPVKSVLEGLAKGGMALQKCVSIENELGMKSPPFLATQDVTEKF